MQDGYRERLVRDNLAPQGIVFGWFGVNPSTADDALEDQTTNKWTGFTVRNGGRKYIAGNPLSKRATNVRDLINCDDPVGPNNAAALRAIIDEVDVLVPCWGDRGKLPRYLRHHLDDLREMLFASGKPVFHLGLTASGDPKHPLFLPYSTPLMLWWPA